MSGEGLDRQTEITGYADVYLKQCQNIENEIALVFDHLQAAAYWHAEASGFHLDGSKTFGDFIALCHSELSEALEAYRDRGMKSWTTPKLNDDLYLKDKPEGVTSELADVLIRIFDMAQVYNLDLGGAVLEKMAYNRTRGHMHGGKAL